MDINNNKLVIKKYMNKFLCGNTCFITDFKEEPSKTPGRKPSVFTNEDNKNNTLSSLPTKNCVH